MAGIRPAKAPIRMAEAMPPDHASAGITIRRKRTDHAGVGVGLGLAIVKSITQAHDGTLTLTPRAAGGLRVTVHLPAAPA